MPFMLAGAVVVHLLFLHQTGSNNPIGTKRETDKIPFHPYFTIKDLAGFPIMLRSLVLNSAKSESSGRSREFQPCESTGYPSTYSAGVIFPLRLRYSTVNSYPGNYASLTQEKLPRFSVLSC